MAGRTYATTTTLGRHMRQKGVRVVDVVVAARVGRWELNDHLNERKHLSAVQCARVADAFDVPVDVLFPGLPENKRRVRQVVAS